MNEFAAEIAFASGGAEWTEDLTGKSERVRVYRFPPPNWDALTDVESNVFFSCSHWLPSGSD